jgi:hypothetical protein
MQKPSFKLADVDKYLSVSLFLARIFWIFSCLSIICGINIFMTDRLDGLILFAIGSFSFFSNSWNVDRTKEFRTIVSIITTMQIRSIDKIAEILMLPYDSVRKDLQTLINKVKVTDIAIDDTLREIVLH